MIVLKTRWDAILPTLATKADLADLKAELKGFVASETMQLTRWMVRLTITMVLGFASLGVAVVWLLLS
jgi:hypothetical protein